MPKTRTIVWQAIQWTGLEYFSLTSVEGGFLADGQLVGVLEHEPYGIQYQIRTDSHWCVREVVVRTFPANDVLIQLTADGQGQWYNQAGVLLPELTGCIDIDLTLSPFTNTLPIRRLHLSPNQPEPIKVVYIELPEGKISPVEQVYTQLSDDCYRFQQPRISFTANLLVDADGLIRDYPDLFRRVK